ncbi:MAG: hypothetical protein Q9166_001099 [cf. Caloplaca sp. 2 TL-2023]
MANLRTAKKELRGLIRQRLSQISEHSVQRQSAAAQETLFSLPEYQSAKSISVYLSMPKGELATGPIVIDALQRGKEVYVPYTYRVDAPAPEAPASVMDMVRLHSQEDFEQLDADPWGIPTPSESSIAHRKRCLRKQSPELDSAEESKNHERLDILIMPGMAFDRRLGRLGHGKGYYDFFLTRYQRLLGSLPSEQSKMPFLVGLALDEQVLPEGEEVPTDASDWRLDALILGSTPLLRR